MHPFTGGTRLIALLLLTVFSGWAAGCGKHADQAPPPVDVLVAPVVQKEVPTVREWVGTLDGSVNAQIRAQVTGILLKQNYREGEAVAKGDPLFEIDPRQFEAALAQATGQLVQAQAEQGRADQDVKRYTPLAADQSISQQELDNAVQGQLAAKAHVGSAQAAVDQAKLNLEFTHIVSPIDGIAGLVQAQIGDLVGPTSGVLTTVSTVDPIKAYFPVAEQTYLAFRGLEPDSPGLPKGTTFSLVLTDGTTYPKAGTLFAIDRQVDVNTGTMRVAVTFPNPNGLLRPGQFARIRATVNVNKAALLVPARALTELQGSYQVAVVDAENHVHLVSVKPGDAVGPLVVVTGLKAGDRVVVEGTQKIKEGAVVNPQPYVVAEAAR